MIGAIVGLWRALVAVPQRIVDWLDPYAGHEEAIRRTGFARGGVIEAGPFDPADDSIPFMPSPGRQITDPDEAEALGLTADARRMRERLRGERS